MRYGVRSVTMDDIAKELGISKKTIYIHFSDKNTIVREVTSARLAKEREMVSEGGPILQPMAHASIPIRIEKYFGERRWRTSEESWTLYLGL